MPPIKLRLLALAAAAAALGCACAEIALIVLEPTPYINKFFEFDPDLGVRKKGHAYGSNFFGFNDADYPLQKPRGAYRVLALGDSFNWAGDRDKNYIGRLRSKLRAVHGDRIEVINAGYPGTHTGEQLALLKKFALQYQPDLVLLGFYAGNDFIDADPSSKRLLVGDTILHIDARRRVYSLFGRPLIWQSRLWPMLAQRWTVLRKTRRNPASPGSYSMSEEAYLRTEFYLMQFYRPSAHRDRRFHRNVFFAFESLAAMKRTLDARGIKLLVAILPGEFSVDDSLADRARAGGGGEAPIPKDDFDPGLAQKILKARLEALGVPCVDLLDGFRAASRTGPLYLTRETHWNDAGNALAAELILPALERAIGLGPA